MEGFFAQINPLIALAVFIAYVVVDGLYAWYTIAVVERKALSTATIGAGMHILLAVGVLSYTENWRYLVPMVIGSWIGTYVVTKYKK